MKKILSLLIIVSFFSCSKKDDTQVAFGQSATYSGKCCETPTLEEILSNTPFAVTNTIGIRQFNIQNLDQPDSSFNRILANDNSITIKCLATGRELNIDWSGSTVVFNVTP